MPQSTRKTGYEEPSPVHTVRVALTLSHGLTCRALQGTGWTCNRETLICTQNGSLGAGASYPPITLTVDVARKATGQATVAATVSGGGSPSSTTSAQTPLAR